MAVVLHFPAQPIRKRLLAILDLVECYAHRDLTSDSLLLDDAALSARIVAEASTLQDDEKLVVKCLAQAFTEDLIARRVARAQASEA